MSGQTGVFPGQNPTLIRHELFKQVRVLEVERVNCEINFGLGSLGADFISAGAAARAALFFVGIRFAWHKKSI